MVVADAGVSHVRRLLLGGARPLRRDRGCRLAAPRSEVVGDPRGEEGALGPRQAGKRDLTPLLQTAGSMGAAFPPDMLGVTGPAVADDTAVLTESLTEAALRPSA